MPYQRASLPSVPLNVVSGKRPPNFAHKYFFKELRAIYEYPNRARQTREREKEESNTMHDPVSISSIQINLTTSTDSHSHDEEVKSEYLTRIVPRNTLKSNIAEGITTENQIELPINQRLSVIDEFIELMVGSTNDQPIKKRISSSYSFYLLSLSSFFFLLFLIHVVSSLKSYFSDHLYFEN